MNRVAAGLYPFERLDDWTSPIPLAVQRASREAGWTLSLSGYRSLRHVTRARLAALGCEVAPDARAIDRLLAEASPAPVRVPSERSPTPSVEGIDVEALHPLDRFAVTELSAQPHRRADLAVVVEVACQRLGISSRRAAVLSTHVDAEGAVRMVDVGDKPATRRRAVARGEVHMRSETALRLANRDVPKGEVLAAARIAGIQAAKRTPDIVPLCHALALTRAEVEITVEPPAARAVVVAAVETTAPTGVEMEALVAVSAACLTLYDMLKGIDREMKISEIVLLEKEGGRRGKYRRSEP